VLAAWEGLEHAQTLLPEVSQSAEYYKNELAVVTRLAAEREKRLAITSYEAQEAERAAAERAERASQEAQVALRKCEEHRQRADWATDERARLAKCYEDACAQARHIGQTLNTLEHDLMQALSAKDSEIDALKERCTNLETDLLTHIHAALEQARAESERLSTLIHGVQQGRFWRLKRFAQRLRRVVHR
jgi:chromosome segregation ATPase